MSLLSEALDRLKKYNLGPFSISSNPFGLTGAGGPDTNLEPMLGDVVTASQATVDNAAAAAGNAAAAAESEDAAAGSAQSAQQDAQATAADRQATGQDRQATAADRQAVAQDRTAVEGSASAAADSATLASQYANAAGGSIPSARLTWDTATADADPGNGKVRLNNATPSAATALYIDNVDAAGASITTVLDRWTSSTAVVKGTLRIAHCTNATKWLEYLVTGTVVDGTGYRKITVTGGTGPGGFAAGDPVAVGFSRAGDMPSSFGPGTTAAPGWAVTGDSNTGLAQVGGADSVSMVGGGKEVFRASPNAAKVFGAVTVGDRGDGFGSALTLTPGTGPDWHLYSRVSDGALVFYHFKDRSGATVATEAMVIRDNGAIEFAAPPTVNGGMIGGGLFSKVLAKSANYPIVVGDDGALIECTASLTLPLPALSSVRAGYTVAVWNSGLGNVVIDPMGAEQINDAATLGLAPGQWAFVVSTGSGWKSPPPTPTATQSAASPCVWSATDREASLIVSNGGLSASVAAGGAMQSGRATKVLYNKRYFEIFVDFQAPSGPSAFVGIAMPWATFSSDYGLAESVGGYGYADDTGRLLHARGETAFGATWNVAGNVIGVAYDDVSTPGVAKIWFRKNGVWQGGGDPATGANPAFTISTTPATFFPAITCKNGGKITARFSATHWAYPAPAGFSQIP